MLTKQRITVFDGFLTNFMENAGYSSTNGWKVRIYNNNPEDKEDDNSNVKIEIYRLETRHETFVRMAEEFGFYVTPIENSKKESV